MSQHFTTVCFNRHPAYDEDTFNCTLKGCLVSRQCCLECEALRNQTTEQKIDCEIKVNERLIENNLEHNERLRGEILQLKLRKILIHAQNTSHKEEKV